MGYRRGRHRGPFPIALFLLLALRSWPVLAADPLPPDGHGSIWSGATPSYKAIFSSEAEAGAFKGEVANDEAASGGKAVLLAVSKAYRPDTEVSWQVPDVPGGFCRAVIRMRARGRSDDGLLGFIEVTEAETGEPLISPRPIHDFHHESTPGYFELAVPFQTSETGSVKVRVAHNGQTDLWVDAMRLEQKVLPEAFLRPAAAITQRTRSTLSLNGEWQFQPVYGDLIFPPPDDWSPVRIRVPSAWNANSFARVNEDQGDFYPAYPPEWEAAEAGWYRLHFGVEDGESGADRSGETPQLSLPLEGRRAVLRFDAVAHAAEIYLNGTAVGYHEGGFTPFEVDVTEALRPGDLNELLVGVRTWYHYHDRKKRKPMTTGSFWGEHVGGIWQNVSLESRPEVFLSDLFIRTSVRRREILVTAEVRNDGDPDRNVSLALTLVPSPAERKPLAQEVPGFPRREGRIQRAGKSLFQWQMGWKNPKLWSPDDPHLYTMAVGLVALAGEDTTPIMDSVVQRFGFREIRIDGRRILLNERRLKLRGDAWHFMGPPQMDPEYAREWYRLAKKTNLNVIRLHAQPFPEFYLDIADEMGMLIIDETSWWASSGGYIYGEEFRERCGQEFEELIRRDRSHPSVIMWSLGNELVAGHAFYSDDGIEDPSELAGLAEDLAIDIRALDGTRPVFSDGDEDLNGLMDVWSLHYPYADVEYPSEKPVVIGEACPMYYAGPLETDGVGGEEVYRSFEARSDAVADIAYWQIRNYRRWAEQITPFNIVWYCLDPLPFEGLPLPPTVLSRAPGLPDRLRPFCSTLNPGWQEGKGIGVYRPNRMYDAIRDALTPRRFFLARRGLRFYTPGRPEIPVLVFNDSPPDETLTMRWVLSVEGTSATHELAVDVPMGEFRRLEPNIPVPDVKERSKGRLDLQLAAGDEVVYSASAQVCLYPLMTRWPETPEVSDKRIVVYTNSDDLLEGLQYLRIGFERIHKFDELAEIRCDLLIIGRSAVCTEEAIEALRQALQEGLRVLFMEGNAVWLEGLGIAKVEPAPYERVFPCRWSHSLVRGMEPSTLEYWMVSLEDRKREDRIERIGEGALAPFQQGSFRPLLSISGGRCVVAEGAEEKGRFFINQMNVLRRLQDEPAALHFLQNLIRYAATAPSWESFPAALIASATSRLSPFIRSLGASGPTLESPMDPFLTGAEGIVLVDASVPDAEGYWPRVRRFVRRGGTAVLWGLTAETLPDWTAEVPGEPRLNSCDSEQLVKVLRENGEPDPLLDGMRHATMYWVKGSLPSPILDHSLRLSRTPEVTPLLEVPAFDWRKWEESSETVRTALAELEQKNPPAEPECGLAAIQMGEGKVFLCQLPVDLNEPRAMELGRQLLTNLGVRLERGTTRQRVAFNVDADGFIRSWLLCGPFTVEGQESLLDLDFLGGETRVEPAPGKAEPDGRQWEPYYSPQPAVDFEVPALYGWMDNAVVYAAVYVYSPRSHEDLLAVPAADRVDLLFGSDDGCNVWLNGDKIYSESASRPLVVDNIRLEGLRFRRGWNLLLFKVEDQVWKWGLVARLVDKSGGFPSGFVVSPEKFSVE